MKILRIINGRPILRQSERTENPGGYPYCYVLALWNRQYVVWQMNLRAPKQYDFHNGNYFPLDQFEKAAAKYERRVQLNRENYSLFVRKGEYI